MSFRSLFARDPFSVLAGEDEFDPMNPANYPTDEDRAAARQAADQTVAFNARDVEENAETIADGPTEPRQPLPLPQPSAPMASNDPEFRPPHAGQGSGGEESYDWRRALTSLFGGSEGVSQYDRQKLAEAAQRMQERQAAQQGKRADATERRAQEMHEALLPKRQAETDALTGKSALLDGRSEASKNARILAAERIKMQAGKMPEGVAKEHALKMVQLLESPTSITNAVDAQRFARSVGADISDMMRGDRQDRAQDEREAMGEARRADMEAKRAAHGAAVSAKVNNVAQRVHLTGDQHKLVSEIASGLISGAEIDNLMPVAEKYANEASDVPGMGKSGIVSGQVQRAKSMLNATSDPEYNEFASALARLYSVERKTFAGVAVTPTEMENLRPFMPDLKRDSEKSIRDKLRDGRRQLDVILKSRMAQLNYDAKGNPIDPSLIARLLSDVAPEAAAGNAQIRRMRGGKPLPQQAPGETPPPDATPKPAGSGASAKIAAIEKVLRDEPNHPQAEALKAKLAKLKGGAGAK